MHTLELREPSIVINSAIEIIEELEFCKTDQLSKIAIMSEEEQEQIGRENIIDICLKLQQYKKLKKDLERVRDFATEQLINVIAENINGG